MHGPEHKRQGASIKWHDKAFEAFEKILCEKHQIWTQLARRGAQTDQKLEKWIHG